MRYLPLTQIDRDAMLGVIGVATIDDLFVDVPEAARLEGPIPGLPMHASEMAVERHMTALSRKTSPRGRCPSSSAAARTSIMCPPRSII